MSTEVSTKDFADNPDKVKSLKIDTEQPVKPQKPMSIDEYIKALRKESEVAKLRASIAKAMFEENMAMLQLNQMRAGQHAVQQANMQPTIAQEEESHNPQDDIVED